MPNQHKSPMLGWHPPAELGQWVRDEAARRGVFVSVVLNEIIEAARAGRIVPLSRDDPDQAP